MALAEILTKALTMILGERAAAFAERHALACNTCQDAKYLEVFRAVAVHVKDLRAHARGLPESEANDFIATHLHAAALRTMVCYQEKYNELVVYTGQLEAVLTYDQKVELERVKAFAKGMH